MVIKYEVTNESMVIYLDPNWDGFIADFMFDCHGTHSNNLFGYMEKKYTMGEYFSISNFLNMLHCLFVLEHRSLIFCGSNYLKKCNTFFFLVWSFSALNPNVEGQQSAVYRTDSKTHWTKAVTFDIERYKLNWTKMKLNIALI